MAKARRDEKVIPAQKELLINFMVNNLDFARGQLLTIERRLEANSLWEMLSEQLNRIGPEKNVSKWQRAWTQLKTKTKRKASTLAASRGKTRGVPPSKAPLSDLEDKIMFIISGDGAYGLEGSDGVSLETGMSSVDINAPCTSTASSYSCHTWVEMIDAPEDNDTSSYTDPLPSPTIKEELPTPAKKKRTTDAVEELMTQNDTTNERIKDIVNEVKEVKNILKDLLQEYKKTNVNLDRIANILDNKK